MNDLEIRQQMTACLHKIKEMKNTEHPADETSSSLIDSLREKITNTLTFYSKYHQNPVNQKIHTVCIPLIMWTSMVWLSEVPVPQTKNLTNLLSIGYFLGYCLYDKKLGAASGVLLAALSQSAELFSEEMSHPKTLAFVLHIAAWIAQIYGHSRYEGNRPAFQDSLLQSLYIAPLFSLIEACEFMGINPKEQKETRASSASMFQPKNSPADKGEENDESFALKKTL
jgi:uncharacterized membrane protein YGL010W